jgi:DNA ligase D-like protein (predicted ligase)
VKPQLTRLVTQAPSGDEWVHELKFDGYRMHARLDRGDVRLLTRTGLDWTGKYPAIAAALRTLPAQQVYLDGELCGVRPDGVTSFALIRNAAERDGGADLVYFVFDLLHLNGRNLMPLPLVQRKADLAALLEGSEGAIRFSDHQIGQGPAFHQHACALGLEGIVSKRLDAPYVPGDRGLWLKTKCLNREEFVVVGWTDPEGSRPFIGALLLGYYDQAGRLIYAGRVGTGMRADQLAELLRRLRPLEVDTMPLDVAPRRSTRFGSPLVLSRVHWVGPELVVEVKYLTGRRTGSCARSFTKGSARTSGHVRSCARSRPPETPLPSESYEAHGFISERWGPRLPYLGLEIQNKLCRASGGRSPS